MSQACYLVLLETSGNQNFIFATNKLRENVGASELTHRGGTTFFDAAITGILGTSRRTLVRTSGKAMLCVNTRETARQVVRAATARALREAPGLELRGAISEEFDFDQPGTIHRQVDIVHRRLAALAAEVPGPRERFQRLPVVEDCRTSGLPAAELGKDGVAVIPISKVTLEKRKAADGGWKRIRAVVGAIPDADEKMLRLAPGPDALDDMKLDWHGVIHADGNGFGQVFLGFHKYLPNGPHNYANQDYVAKMRAFSDTLDTCTRSAFQKALEAMATRWRPSTRVKYLPVVPLVLGGDDLTVICDGEHAVQLARDFLRAFEEEATRRCHELGLVNLPERFSACAGVAIVKPHYPFYAAYELSKALLHSAKVVKKHAPRCSALDYHILYDASGSLLVAPEESAFTGTETIRSKLCADDDTTSLVARPYVVTPPAKFSPSPWAARRLIDDLEKRIRTMKARDEEDQDRHRLPRGLLHDLREGLFLGWAAAEARLGLVRESYQKALAPVLTQGRLFFTEGNGRATNFLDALDLVEFWQEDRT